MAEEQAGELLRLIDEFNDRALTLREDHNGNLVVAVIDTSARTRERSVIAIDLTDKQQTRLRAVLTTTEDELHICYLCKRGNHSRHRPYDEDDDDNACGSYIEFNCHCPERPTTPSSDSTPHR